MPGRPKTGYIPTLDGWRAIAIGMVLVCHLPLTAWTSGHGARLQNYFGYGALGVDLFFAISGLLICSRLLEEERMTGRISLRGFYVRRCFRIFPAAYLYLIVIAVIGLLHVIPMDWPAWASALVFLRNYFTCLVRDTGANRFTGHFWSLAIEEHFYLLLPSLLVFFPRHRKMLLLALTVLAFTWLGIYVHSVPPDQRSIFWDRRTDLRIGSLLFPAWIALFFVEQHARERMARWIRPSTMWVLFSAIVAALLVKRHFFHHAAAVPAPVLNDIYASAPRGGDAGVVMNLMPPFLFPLLILSTTLHPGSWPGRVLEWKPLRKLGRISYSLYLWQQLFWVMPYTGWKIAGLEKAWTAIPLTFACAIASYLFVEKPLVRLGHRIAPPPTPGHRDLRAAAPSGHDVLNPSAALPER